MSLTKDLNTCQTFAKQSDFLAGQAKPKQLNAEMQWIDWQPTFQNYSKLVPGIASVPLAYVIWRQPTPGPNFVGDVLDNYIVNAPLVSANFYKDS